MQRSERGGHGRAGHRLLPALTGSWKDVGGGLQLSTSRRFHLNRAALERPDLQQRALGREARVGEYVGAGPRAERATAIRR